LDNKQQDDSNQQQLLLLVPKKVQRATRGVELLARPSLGLLRARSKKKATAGQIDGRTGGDQPAQGAVESKKHISKVSIQDNNSNGASGSASFGCFVRENWGGVELGVELGWNQFHLDRRLLGGDPPLRRIG